VDALPSEAAAANGDHTQQHNLAAGANRCHLAEAGPKQDRAAAEENLDAPAASALQAVADNAASQEAVVRLGLAVDTTADNAMEVDARDVEVEVATQGGARKHEDRLDEGAKLQVHHEDLSPQLRQCHALTLTLMKELCDEFGHHPP